MITYLREHCYCCLQDIDLVIEGTGVFLNRKKGLLHLCSLH